MALQPLFISGWKQLSAYRCLRIRLSYTKPFFEFLLLFFACGDETFGMFLGQLGVELGIFVVVGDVVEKVFNVFLEVGAFLNGHDGEGLECVFLQVDNLPLGGGCCDCTHDLIGLIDFYMQRYMIYSIYMVCLEGFLIKKTR